MILSGVAHVVMRVGNQDIHSEIFVSPDMTGFNIGNRLDGKK